jgi:hypothetical protein
MQLRLSFASLQLFVFFLASSLFLLNSDMYAHATLLGDNEGKMDPVDGMKGAAGIIWDSRNPLDAEFPSKTKKQFGQNFDS